jgi:hypothetical protein
LQLHHHIAITHPGYICINCANQQQSTRARIENKL